MFDNDRVKFFCSIFMILVFIASIVLVCVGIAAAIDGNSYSIYCFISAVLLPPSYSISVFHIFALSSIDENIIILNQKVQRLSTNGIKTNEIDPEPVSTDPQTNDVSVSDNKNKETQTTDCDKLDDVFLFMSQVYSISISKDDSLEALKKKIREIKSEKASILKCRIESAKTKDEIFNILSMHKAVAKKL